MRCHSNEPFLLQPFFSESYSVRVILKYTYLYRETDVSEVNNSRNHQESQLPLSVRSQFSRRTRHPIRSIASFYNKINFRTMTASVPTIDSLRRSGTDLTGFAASNSDWFVNAKIMMRKIASQGA